MARHYWIRTQCVLNERIAAHPQHTYTGMLHIPKVFYGEAERLAEEKRKKEEEEAKKRMIYYLTFIMDGYNKNK